MFREGTATREGADIVFSWKPGKAHFWNEVRFVGYFTENSLFTSGSSVTDLVADATVISEYLRILVGAFQDFLRTPWATAVLPQPILVPYSNIDEVEDFLYESHNDSAGATFFTATIIPQNLTPRWEQG